MYEACACMRTIADQAMTIWNMVPMKRANETQWESERERTTWMHMYARIYLYNKCKYSRVFSFPVFIIFFLLGSFLLVSPPICSLFVSFLAFIPPFPLSHTLSSLLQKSLNTTHSKQHSNWGIFFVFVFSCLGIHKYTHTLTRVPPVNICAALVLLLVSCKWVETKRSRRKKNYSKHQAKQTRIWHIRSIESSLQDHRTVWNRIFKRKDQRKWSGWVNWKSRT